MVFISLNITGNGRVFISINDMMRFVRENSSWERERERDENVEKRNREKAINKPWDGRG